MTTSDAVETYRRTTPGRGRPASPETVWNRLRSLAVADQPPSPATALPALWSRATTRRLALPELLADRLGSPPGTFVGGAQLAGTTASDGVIDLYATESVAQRLVQRLSLEDDPDGRLALHVVSLPELPELSERERLTLAWCDLADRADPAADVAIEALWPGSVEVVRIADVRARGGQVPYPALRGVVDWIDRHPQLAERAIGDRPPPTGDAGIDSLLAGVAETIAQDHGLDLPGWTASVRAAPLEVLGTIDSEDDHWNEVPAPLAARGLGFRRETFWRRR